MSSRPPKAVKPAVVAASNVAELAKARSERDGDTAPEVAVITPGNAVRKKEFSERVVARAGVRRSDAKAALDATLAVLAEALADGQELILPPLGRIKVTRDKAGKNNRVLVLKIALPKPDSAATEGLAEADD